MLGLPESAFVVLFVGRAVHTKGFDLVSAATDPAYEIVAVTDAPAAPRPGLRVLGFMDAERLGRLQRAADAFLLPSRGEGFPLSLQEAMCAGLPVVTTMLPGYDRFLTADDVLVVPPDATAIRDALRRLADDAELQGALAARSAAVAARHFSADHFVDAYEDLYERLRAAG
jgi:glycosyltransferase involved in cell wall biosynthesis